MGQEECAVLAAGLALISVCLVAAVASLWSRLARVSAARLEAERDLRRALTHAERSLAHTQAEHDFLLGFLREFPHLTRELHSTTNPREIPGLLLNMLTRVLAPEAAVVLVRRQSSESEPLRHTSLVVAATTKGARASLGVCVPAEEGEVAAILEGQRVQTREELRASGLVLRPAGAAWAGLGLDLLAPLVFGEHTLGLIGLKRPARSSDGAKAVLRFVSQAAAQVLHDALAYSQMKTTADLDGLTGVYNKRHMTRALSEAILDAQQRLASLSVFLFDIDHFKSYNDLNGHVAGDQLLRELAQLVRDNVRKADVFGRFGGEEFLLVLPDTAVGPALVVAEKLRGLIADHAFAFRDRQPLGMLSVSGGVAEYPADALEGARLLEAADTALYSAKRHGRNRVLAAERHYFSEEPGEGTPGPGTGG
jgi:diguanylate cyclase (GGDEF)-like protein